MSLIALNTSNIVFDVREPLPLKGFPEGRAKICLRNDSFARVFIKTASGIRAFFIKEEAGCWVPDFELAANRRLQ